MKKHSKIAVSTHTQRLQARNVRPNQYVLAAELWTSKFAQNQEYIYGPALPQVESGRTETMVQSFTPIFDHQAHWGIGDMLFRHPIMTSSVVGNRWGLITSRSTYGRRRNLQNPLDAGQNLQMIGLASFLSHIGLDLDSSLPIRTWFGWPPRWLYLKNKERWDSIKLQMVGSHWEKGPFTIDDNNRASSISKNPFQ